MTAVVDAEPAVEPTLAAPPTRVLHAINGEHYSGAERVQDLLAQWLPECGFSVGFACLKPDRFPRMRQSQEAPLHPLAMRGKLDLRAAWRLADIVRSEGYALIHAHTPRSALVARLAAARAGVPMVYHVHSPAARDSTRGWTDRMNALVERASLAGGVRLIAVSQSLGRHMIAAGFPAQRVTVVPNGVPQRAAPAAWRRPEGEWTLGMVALFRPRKGLEVLLDALADLRREGLPLRLRAVGPFETADYQADILARAARLKIDEQIDWTGFTSDVTAELARIDLFVLPSLFGEGLPMVVLEAMAAGVPVVATRVEGVPEAVRDGEDGLLAAPGDPADLARAIGRLVRGEADAEALRHSALARQRDHFSARSMARGVAAVYRKLLP